MKALCASCGSALDPDSAFCTGCGAAAPASAKPKKDRRKWLWILALLLVFVLGILLGRLLAPKCPHCPAPATTGTGGGGAGGGGGGGNPKTGGGGDGGQPSHGGGGGGGGSGRVLGDGGRTGGSGGSGGGGAGAGVGDMAGGGSSNANGTTIGHGYDGSAVGANGSDDSGGGTDGKGSPADAPNGPDSDPDAKKAAAAGVWQLAAGGPLSPNGLDAPVVNGKDVSIKVLTAPDFRYDKTGLPRYPDANKSVASAMSYDVQGQTNRYHSSSGIVTGGSFDDVVSWYQKNLPAGWSDSTLNDLNRLGAMAQQLSPDKIMQMLAPQPGAAPAKSVSDIPATATTDRVRISMFKPPPGTNPDLGVMVVQQGDKPVTIFMKTHVSP